MSTTFSERSATCGETDQVVAERTVRVTVEQRLNGGRKTVGTVSSHEGLDTQPDETVASCSTVPQAIRKPRTTVVTTNRDKPKERGAVGSADDCNESPEGLIAQCNRLPRDWKSIRCWVEDWKVRRTYAGCALFAR